MYVLAVVGPMNNSEAEQDTALIANEISKQKQA